VSSHSRELRFIHGVSSKIINCFHISFHGLFIRFPFRFPLLAFRTGAKVTGTMVWVRS